MQWYIPHPIILSVVVLFCAVGKLILLLKKLKMNKLIQKQFNFCYKKQYGPHHMFDDLFFIWQNLTFMITNLLFLKQIKEILLFYFEVMKLLNG